MSPFSIVVVADDLSGAAELAALVAARGVSAEVQRQFDPSTSAAVVSIDCNSRGELSERAVEKAKAIAEQIHSAGIQRVFKKVDSVLRGHVRAEVETWMDILSRARALLAPANPSRNRTIVAGRYLIDGVPLENTIFASDPDFPRTSSRVSELLGVSGQQAIHSLAVGQPLPAAGIAVPDIASAADLAHRAHEIDATTLPAGAADFFSAMLDRWLGESPGAAQSTPLATFAPPALLVCGSLAAWNRQHAACSAGGITVITIDKPSAAELVAAVLRTGAGAMLAIGDKLPAAMTGEAVQQLAIIAAELLRRVSPRTVLVEGGATAAALSDEMHWSRFAVEPIAAAGVGALRPLAPNLVPLVLIKPGSYGWPDELWQALGAKGIAEDGVLSRYILSKSARPLQ